MQDSPLSMLLWTTLTGLWHSTVHFHVLRALLCWTAYLLEFYRFSKVYSYLIYLVSPINYGIRCLMLSVSSCLLIYWWTLTCWLLHKEANELYLQLANWSYASVCLPRNWKCVCKRPHLHPKVLKSLLLSFVCAMPIVAEMEGTWWANSTSREELEVLGAAKASSQHPTQILIRVYSMGLPWETSLIRIFHTKRTHDVNDQIYLLYKEINLQEMLTLCYIKNTTILWSERKADHIINKIHPTPMSNMR